ncbi:MAG TPA: hypothetical protein PK788_12100, partial [Gemmatimonadaceae bacterium]|nr:hypothetical protein [Gemmatimonadaceae bacterium]
VKAIRGSFAAVNDDWASDVSSDVLSAMSDFLLNGLTFSGSIPEDDVPGGYGSNVLFNITATFTRGTRFGAIQRNVSGAWTFLFLPASAEVTLESFASNSGGATHSLGVRVKGARTASPTMGHSSVSDGTGGTSNPDKVTFTANPSGLGGTGQTLIEIIPQYVPDNGPFNDTLVFDAPDSWQGYFDNRGLDATADFDYEWRTASGGGGSLISSLRSFKLSTDSGWYNGSENVGKVYPTAWEYPDSPYSGINGLLPGETSQAIYLRWRVKVSSGGSGTWNNYGPVTHTDPRDAV